MELKVAKIDARKEGLAEGRAAEKKESAYRLLKLGIEPRIVAEGTGLPLAEVQDIARNQ